MTDKRRLEAIIALSLLLGVIGLVTSLAPLLVATVVVLAVGLVSRSLSGLIASGWWALGLFLGRISTTIILALVFYLLLTPVGLFARATGRIARELSWRDLEPRLVERERKLSKEDLEDPF